MIDWQQEGVLAFKSLLGEGWHGVPWGQAADPVTHLARLYDEQGVPVDMMYCYLRDKGLDIDSDHFTALVKRGVDYRQGRIKGGEYV